MERMDRDEQVYAGKKFLIVAPGYMDTNGGVVVQHKLCHLLNSIGYEAHLYPLVNCRISVPHGRLRCVWDGFKDDLNLFLYRIGKRFATNSYFKTPIACDYNWKKSEDWIVVYPEIVTGNPLRAKNVVRWLLHQPGYFSKMVCYGRGELYFRYGSNIKPFFVDGSWTSENLLKVIHYPTEHYNMDHVKEIRAGVAYCIRKGKNKSLKFLPENAILIDGMTHEEVSKIFKRVKCFISFDDYTAYSWFALMCGCDVVVVPTEGVSEEQWYPEAIDRYGIAYGIDRLEWARNTAHLQLERLARLAEESEYAARNFAAECIDFFRNKRDMGYRSGK